MCACSAEGLSAAEALEALASNPIALSFWKKRCCFGVEAGVAGCPDGAGFVRQRRGRRAK